MRERIIERYYYVPQQEQPAQLLENTQITEPLATVPPVVIVSPPQVIETSVPYPVEVERVKAELPNPIDRKPEGVSSPPPALPEVPPDVSTKKPELPIYPPIEAGSSRPTSEVGTSKKQKSEEKSSTGEEKSSDRKLKVYNGLGRRHTAAEIDEILDWYLLYNELPDYVTDRQRYSYRHHVKLSERRQLLEQAGYFKSGTTSGPEKTS